MAPERQETIINLGQIPRYVSRGVRRGHISETEAKTILEYVRGQGGVGCLWIRAFERNLKNFSRYLPGEVGMVFSDQLRQIADVKAFFRDGHEAPKIKG